MRAARSLASLDLRAFSFRDVFQAVYALALPMTFSALPQSCRESNLRDQSLENSHSARLAFRCEPAAHITRISCHEGMQRTVGPRLP